eukprot:12230991-Alexandrium_andersonii.AAC.1
MPCVCPACALRVPSMAIRAPVPAPRMALLPALLDYLRAPLSRGCTWLAVFEILFMCPTAPFHNPFRVPDVPWVGLKGPR